MSLMAGNKVVKVCNVGILHGGEGTRSTLLNWTHGSTRFNSYIGKKCVEHFISEMTHTVDTLKL